MSNYEQSHTEGHKGNTSTASRKNVGNSIGNGIISEISQKASDEGRKARAEQFGRNSERIVEFRNIGINDRICARQYDEQKCSDKYDQSNYHEGFYVMGNRVIHGKLETFSNNDLQTIGANDYISGVDITSLPEAIKNNPSYFQGYMMATIFREDNKKSRR